MRKRKLITQATMDKILEDLSRGVPLARAMRNNDLNMSRPAVAKLVTQYQAAQKHEHLRPSLSSLFPLWLAQDGQEPPDTCRYEGYFPHGTWT